MPTPRADGRSSVLDLNRQAVSLYFLYLTASAVAIASMTYWVATQLWRIEAERRTKLEKDLDDVMAKVGYP